MTDNVELGTVVCQDFTKGRQAPLTVSRLSSKGEGFWWGRQELAVYILSLPVLFFNVATWQAGTAWWPLITVLFPGFTGLIVTVLVMVGVPFLIGALVSAAGVKTRDIPRLAGTVVSSVPRPWTSGRTSFYEVTPAPSKRTRAEAWVIPDWTDEP